MRISVRTIVLLILAALAGIVAFWLVPAPLPELSRAEFMDEVRAGHVRGIVIDEDVIKAESSIRGPFRTLIRKGEHAELATHLRGLGVEVRIEKWTPLGF